MELTDIDGRPVNVDDLPSGFDASCQLNNKLHERFAGAVAEMAAKGGIINKTEAYRASTVNGVNRQSAGASAIRLCRRAEVAMRIVHLVNEKRGVNHGEPDEIEIDVTQLSTKEGIIETLMALLASSSLQRGSDQIKTLLELYRMQGFDREKVQKDWIDPSHVLAWMASVEMDGMTVMQAIEKQEGFKRLVAVMAKLFDAERVLVERRDACAEWTSLPPVTMNPSPVFPGNQGFGSAGPEAR